MSISRIVRIPCPYCGEEIDFEVFDSVNVTKDPELKERVLNLEIFQTHCDKCGKTRIIEYPMLYHDMEKNYMILLSNENDIMEWQYMMNPDTFVNTVFDKNLGVKYTRRGVTSIVDLISKINILDSQLDDRVIEIIKKDCLQQVKEKHRQEKNRNKLLYSRITQIPNTNDLVIVLGFDKEEEKYYVVTEQQYQYYYMKYKRHLENIDEVLISEEFIDKFTHESKTYFDGMYEADIHKLYCIYDTSGAFHLCLKNSEVKEKINVDDIVIMDIDGVNIKGKVAKIVEKGYYQLPKWEGHFERIVSVYYDLELKTVMNSDEIIDDSKIKTAFRRHKVEKVQGGYGEVLAALNDAVAIVPFNVVTDNLDVDKILELGVGGTFEANLKMEKVLLEIKDKTYMPIYTSDSELKDTTGLSLMKYSFRQILDLAKLTSNISGVVVNPDTDCYICDNSLIRGFDKSLRLFRPELVKIEPQTFSISLNIEEMEKRKKKENVYFYMDETNNKIIKKVDGQFELEYISKDNPGWAKTYKNHPYERKYYYHEGDIIFNRMNYDEVVQQFKEWKIPLCLLGEEEDIDN